MRLAAIALLCACLPRPGGECASDADCLGGLAGSFCAESICQGPPQGLLEPLPSRAFSRGEALHVRLRVQRTHGVASARVMLGGHPTAAQPEADGALGALVPLSLAPPGTEGAVNLSAELSDDLGHTTTFAAQVSVDDLGPRAAFDDATLPREAVLRGSKISLRIVAHDLTAVSVEGATKNPDGSFSLPVDTAKAPPGAPVFEVAATAVDAAGNRSIISTPVPLTRLKYFVQHPAALPVSSMVLTGTRILATAGTSEFWFLDRATGATLVRPATTGTVLQRIATDGSRLFFSRDDDMVCRLLPDGKVEVCCGPVSRLTQGPVLSGGDAIVTTSANSASPRYSQRFVAIPDLGPVCTPIAATDAFSTFVPGAPSIAADGTVYAGAGTYVAGSVFDGTTWSTPQQVTSSEPYIDQPVFRDESSLLFAIEGGFDTVSATHLPVSKQLTPDRGFLSPTVAADGTVLAASDATLFAVALDGSIRWSRIFDSSITAPPVAGAGDVIYAGFASGQILAVSLANGATIWSYDGTVPIRGSLAPGCDGLLYASTSDGIVAVVIDSPGLANSPWPRAGHDVRNSGDARRPLRSETGTCLE